MTTPTPLAIPDEAFAALFDAIHQDADTARTTLCRVVAPIVAAELRRTAMAEASYTVWPDTLGNWTAGQAEAARTMKSYLLNRLRARADELGGVQ